MFDLVNYCADENFKENIIPANYEKDDFFEDYDEYLEIVGFADEDVFCIGNTGYYYYGVLAIGRSGKLYVKHDYDWRVRVYDTLLEYIEDELRSHEDILLVSNKHIGCDLMEEMKKEGLVWG